MNIEHSATDDELELTADIDFVVPLKQVGLITRAVLEAIKLFYKPRRIVVVTAQDEARILKDLVQRWDCGRVECLNEETFFQPNFGLSLEAIRATYDYNRHGEQREPGWWIQQLIKLGAATQINDISSVYVVWDGKFHLSFKRTSYFFCSCYRRFGAHASMATVRKSVRWPHPPMVRCNPPRRKQIRL